MITDDGHKCIDCGLEFADRDRYVNHRKQDHTEEEKHPEAARKKAAQLGIDLDEHDFPIGCPECDGWAAYPDGVAHKPYGNIRLCYDCGHEWVEI